MIIYSDEKQIFNNVKNEWYDIKKIPCFKYCSKIYARKEEIISLLKEAPLKNTENVKGFIVLSLYNVSKYFLSYSVKDNFI